MEDNMFGDTSNPRSDPARYVRLAAWLREVVGMPSPPFPDTTQQNPKNAESSVSVSGNVHHIDIQLGSDYHLPYYQQLPDFIMMLLRDDQEAALHYAPLLYHLAGCRACHQGYLELYDAMRAALSPRSERSALGQGTRTLAATPHRMLGHLCRVLIDQAEVVLRQARREHQDKDASARQLLQLALRISAHIQQSTIRRDALQDLVRVATLFEGPAPPQQEEERGIYPFTSQFAGIGGMRGKKVMRRAEAPFRPQETEQPVILLQWRIERQRQSEEHRTGMERGGLATQEARVSQHGQTLELSLHDLEPALRGQYVAVDIPLGSLIEPVRWRGGNPRAIRSTAPVAADGSLTVPLGETELLLINTEDRNLLEAMFLLLEIRAVAPA